MKSQAKVRATPLQLRRTGYLVAGIAVFVALYSIYTEIDYASFCNTARRVEARIVKIDVIREGQRLRHVLHYQLELDGRSLLFSDPTPEGTKLEDLYTGSFNAFTSEDPPLAVGKTIGLLVDPDDPRDHRPDRDELPNPQFLWIRTVLALLFLSGVAGVLLWAGREPKEAQGSSSPSSRPPRARNSKVTSALEGGVLRVRAVVDVPWPGASSPGDTHARLRERMQQLKAELKQEQGDSAVSDERVESVELKLELHASEASLLHEARLDFIGASGEEASETVARRVELPAQASKKVSATLPVPSGTIKLRLVLMLLDRTTWEHELSL